MGKFGGIAEQIEQNLLDLVLVGIGGGRSGAIAASGCTPGRDQWLGRRETSSISASTSNSLGNVNTSCFDLGQIENRINQAQQMLGAGENFAQVIDLFFGQLPSPFRWTIRVKPISR